jgi:hypothetical protein
VAETLSLRQQIDELDRRLGKGRTYSAEERNLILDRIVPERVIRGARFGSPALRERCTKLVDALKSTCIQVDREIPIGREAGGGG